MSKVGVIKLNIPTNCAQLIVACVKKSFISEEDNELPMFIFTNNLEEALARKRRTPDEVHIEIERSIALGVFQEFALYFHPDGDDLRAQNSISRETEAAFLELSTAIAHGLGGRKSRRHSYFQIDDILLTAQPSQRSKLKKRQRLEESILNQPLNPLPMFVTESKKANFS